MIRLVGCVIAIVCMTLGMLFFLLWIKKRDYQIKGTMGMWMLIAFALRILVTIVFSFSEKSTHTDMIYWIRWTEFFTTHKFAEYYSLHVGDYTPGFMYWLKLTANILVSTGQPVDGMLAQLLYKLPAMLTDCLAGLLIYKCATESGQEERIACTCGVLFMFHPAVIFLSTIWGQIDIIHSVLIVLSFYLLYKKKLVTSAVVIGLAILIKLQTVFVGPIYIVLVLLYLCGRFGKESLGKRLQKTVAATIAGVGILIIGCIPGGIAEVYVQVTQTLSQYQYASMNAANFWALIGLNMQSQDGSFLGISYATYGYLFLIFAIVLSVLFTLKTSKKEIQPGRYLEIAGWMYLFVFTFTVRMHERYVYPALLLFLCAYVIDNSMRDYQMFTLTSLCCFVNLVSFITIAKYEKTFAVVLRMDAAVVVCICVYITVLLVKEKFVD